MLPTLDRRVSDDLVVKCFKNACAMILITWPGVPNYRSGVCQLFPIYFVPVLVRRLWPYKAQRYPALERSGTMVVAEVASQGW